MTWLTRVGQALSGEIMFRYESTVEPVSGKRQREFEHRVPAAWAAIILMIAMPGSILAAEAAFGSPGPDSPSLERPDDRGDDMGQGQGQGTSQGGPDGQGTGRGNGTTTTEAGGGSSSTSTPTTTSTSPGSGSSTTTTTPTSGTNPNTPSTSTPSGSSTAPTTTTLPGTTATTVSFFWPPTIGNPPEDPPPGSICTCTP